VRVVTAPQLSPEWFAARGGLLTASVVADIYSTRKDKKEPAGRRDLRMRLAIERLTGKPVEDTYSNPDMERGRMLEASARAAYEMAAGVVVHEIGLCVHDELPAGASPDGVVGDDGLLEIKCPRAANHIATVQADGEIPEDYIPQVTHALWVTGRAWLDFVSYCPDLPSPLDLHIVRVIVGHGQLAAHELMVRAFLKEVDATVDELTALMTRRAVA
jgi:putative phage-type endonuclease